MTSVPTTTTTTTTSTMATPTTTKPIEFCPTLFPDNKDISGNDVVTLTGTGGAFEHVYGVS